MNTKTTQAPAEDDALIAAQLELERDGAEAAVARYREILAEKGHAESTPGQALMRRTIGQVIAGIAEWQADYDSGKAGRGLGVVKFLCQYEPEEVAMVALREVVACLHRPSAKLTQVAREVTRKLEAVDLTARLKAQSPQLYARYCKFASRHNRVDWKLAALRRDGMFQATFNARKNGFKWSDSERTKLGLMLVEMVCEVTGIAEIASVPSGNGRTVYVIRPTDATESWLAEAHRRMEILHPVLYPMVVPPIPWSGTKGGGYLTDRPGFQRDLVRGRLEYKQDLSEIEMPSIYGSLNALQETRWAVNMDVLRVVQRNLKGDDSITGLTGERGRYEVPERHRFMDVIPRDQWTEEQQAEFKAWCRAKREVMEAREIQMAKRQSTLATVASAAKVSSYPVIYFPWSLDWRGRAYPVVPGFNPQGRDLAKALLQFAAPKPLGEYGLRWLAFHGANSYGIDKVSIEEREQWVLDHHAEIMADALDPFREHAFWAQTGEAPFQFLAFCFEWCRLTAWIDEEKPVSEFMSRLPVGIDGSCNGLQHYSAILRDPIGGSATNLTPHDKPADIYTLVANKVAAQAEVDAAGDETDEDEMKRRIKPALFWIEKGVTRKWTKRNTMTQPYGVTFIGMQEQLWDELGSFEQQRQFFNDTSVDVYPPFAVTWLAKANARAIERTVVSAAAAMSWLKKVAVAVASKDMPINWETADGFPVQQSYNAVERIRVEILDAKYKLTIKKDLDSVDRTRMRLGFAPNFVHSIDATHMRMVVKAMAERGVTDLAMVHDSFGAHAGHMEDLARVTRETFVELHQKDFLGDLYESLKDIFDEEALEKVGPPPERGTLDLTQVLESRYFFA